MKQEEAIRWMTLFNEKIQVNKDYLSQLDTPIGDGDHGGNMARGMAAVMEELSSKEFPDTTSIFKSVGMQLLSKVGGASGPLYGSAFIGISKEIDTNSLEAALQMGLNMIQTRGKAEVGEKTMVDVWQPVLADLKQGALSKEKIDAYVLATENLQASKGRASYVGERSIGHIDPGSASSGFLFQSLLEAEVF